MVEAVGGFARTRMNKSPSVSVIMAAYNASDHIDAAIDCLRRQTLTDWELAVVDDASADSTRDKLQAAAAQDPRIRPVRLAVNAGPAHARNVALQSARGAWVAIMDCDDLMASDRLQVLHDRAERDRLDIVADNLLLYDRDARREVGRAFLLPGESVRLDRQRLVRNDGPPRVIGLGHLKPFIRRSLISSSRAQYPTDVRLGEDFCFLFELLGATDRALLIDYAGYRYTLPFGMRAGQEGAASHASHKSDGLDDLLTQNERLKAANADAPDGRLAALLDARGRRIRDEAHWRAARGHAKAGRFVRAAAGPAKVELSFLLAQINSFRKRRMGDCSARIV